MHSGICGYQLTLSNLTHYSTRVPPLSFTRQASTPRLKRKCTESVAGGSLAAFRHLMEGTDDLLQPDEINEEAADVPKASSSKAVSTGRSWALRSVLKGKQQSSCTAS